MGFGKRLFNSIGLLYNIYNQATKWKLCFGVTVEYASTIRLAVLIYGIIFKVWYKINCSLKYSWAFNCLLT